MPSEVIVRPAHIDELTAAAQVYLDADTELDLRLHGRILREPVAPGDDELAGMVADLAFVYAESVENVWVAVVDGQIIGMASSAIRGRQWLLTNFFVLPRAQGQGIGRQLLARIHEVGMAAGCDIFSLHATEDPKAHTRYLRLGLVPQPPTIVMETDAPVFSLEPWVDGLQAQSLDGSDPALLATVGDLDKAVRGCCRSADLARWFREGARGALLTHHGTTTPAGYFLVTDEGASGRIGPVVALDVGRVPAMVNRALAHASTLHRPGLRWRALVPGQNQAAVAPLLAANFRPTRLSTFFSSVPIGRYDRYVFHDEDFE